MCLSKRLTQEQIKTRNKTCDCDAQLKKKTLGASSLLSEIKSLDRSPATALYVPSKLWCSPK